MGFLGYRRHEHGVRVFLECSDDGSCSYPIDVLFSDTAEPRFTGVTDVFALKKFYKVINSLEERAREQGRPRQAILESAEQLVEHLRLTNNAREFAEDPPSRR